MTPSEENVAGLSFVGGQLPAELAEALKRVAVKHDRPVSAELRQAIRAHVERYDKPGEANGGRAS